MGFFDDLASIFQSGGNNNGGYNSASYQSSGNPYPQYNNPQNTGQQSGGIGGFFQSLGNLFTAPADNYVRQYYSMQIECMDIQMQMLSNGQRGIFDALKQKTEAFGASMTPEMFQMFKMKLNSPEIAQANQRTEEYVNSIMRQKKPGALCFIRCSAREEDCQECLKRQEALLQLLSSLEELDDAVNSNDPEKRVLTIKTISSNAKCSLCGAPVEEGESECPFCGTEYGDVFSEEEVSLPSSSAERHRLLADKASEFYSLYLEWNEYRRSISRNVVDTIARFYPNYIAAYFYKMDEYDNFSHHMDINHIISGARYYNMSEGKYISEVIGVIQNSFDYDKNPNAVYPWYVVLIHDESNAMQKQLEVEREQQRKAHEAEMAAINARAKSQQEFWKRWGATHQAPQYNGGGGGSGSPGVVCGNCVNYMPSNGRCAAGNRTDGASQGAMGCGEYHSK